MAHAPITMRRVANEGAVEKLGDFAWYTNEADTRFIKMAVPRGTTPDAWLFCIIPVKLSQKIDSHWEWDGNEDAPTLTPSVNHVGHWHGFVRGGTLVEA